MAYLTLKGINKIYPNGFHAVHDFNLEIEKGEFIVLVGSSGCGKSTTLRMIAGLENISKGEFLINGEYANDKSPREREIAMVFQSYALYPQMSVYDNLAFGLTLQGVDEDVIDEKVNHVAAILGLTEYLDRMPRALSGGQRQRVAVGRAIIRKVGVFLMDEPLSNLDAKLRGEMRTELKRLHRSTGATFVYVTHDQLEAMTLSTRICLMHDGVLQQFDAPLTVYRRPVNLFVADFVGNPAMNLIPTVAKQTGESSAQVNFLGYETRFEGEAPFKMEGEEVVLGIRPEFLPIREEGDFEGTAYSTLPAGMETTVKVKVGDSILSSVIFGAIDYPVDTPLRFGISSGDILLFDKKTGKLLSAGRLLPDTKKEKEVEA